MAENSDIGWCDHTHNFWIGCQQVSPACDNCYAMVLNRRHKWVGDGGWNGKDRYETRTCKLQSWDNQAEAFYVEHGRPQMVFINSLSDFFDNQVPPAYRTRAWMKIRDNCKHMVVMLLTKRPQNALKMLPEFWDEIKHRVWVGTTVENQTEAERRIPQLVQIPCALRFLSCEPLLGPIDIAEPIRAATLEGLVADTSHNTRPIGWAIAGGESGPGARPTDPNWFRSLRDACCGAGIPYFFKQWGGRTPNAGGHELDGDIIQEFPEPWAGMEA